MSGEKFSYSNDAQRPQFSFNINNKVFSLLYKMLISRVVYSVS